MFYVIQTYTMFYVVNEEWHYTFCFICHP